MKTIGEFRLIWDDFAGANLGLSNDRFSNSDGSRVLVGDCRSLQRWDAEIEQLIEDLERVRREGQVKLRNWRSAMPSEDTDG